jgi:hypothetical protein
MSNTILTPTAVTREALRVLHQKLNFIGTINRQYDDQYAKDGAKIGSDLKIRMPNQYTVRSGAAIDTQETTETSQTLTVATQKGVDLNFTSTELTLSLQDFSDRILEPAMSVLAANIEYDAMSMYKDVYNSIWNSGAAATYSLLLDGRVKLQNGLTPNSKRTANMSPQPMSDLVKDTKTLFQDQAQLSKQYLEGYMGRAASFDFVENTLWPGHTRGASASNVCNTSTGITSGSSSITVSGGSGAANIGDVFTIVGVNSVHPETKADSGVLQQFVLTAAALTGATTFVVSPTPVTSGATQNIVINSAGSSKTVTFGGTASDALDTSLLYNKDAFTFATADLVMPKGVDFAAREVMDGISIRIVRDYDINSDRFPARLDVLYGYKTLRPQWACRFHNN